MRKGHGGLAGPAARGRQAIRGFPGPGRGLAILRYPVLGAMTHCWIADGREWHPVVNGARWCGLHPDWSGRKPLNESTSQCLCLIVHLFVQVSTASLHERSA